MTERILRAYYDLAVAPPTFDIVVFLYLAEMERLHLGFDSIELIVVAGPKDGFRDDLDFQPISDKVWHLNHVVLPAHQLLPACRRAIYYRDRQEARRDFDPTTPVFPAGYTIDEPISKYLDSEILIAHYAGKPFGTLRAPATAISKIRHWMGHYVGDRKAIVITLAQETRRPPRNNNLDQWIQFARTLDPKIYQPIFLRDPADVFEKPDPRLDPYLVCDPAAVDVALRLALYESAHINLFADSDAAACCMLDDRTRCTRFVLLRSASTQAEPLRFYRRGYREGMQWAGTTSHQISVWEDDTADRILRAFTKLELQLQSDIPPSGRPSPPVSLVASNFIAGENYRDAITATSIALNANPEDVQAQYLHAMALLKSGDCSAALNEFQALFSIPQIRETVLIPYVICLWQSGQIKQAVQLLRAMTQEKSDNLSLLKSIAQLLMEVGEETEGAKIFDRLVTIRPKDASILLAYAAYLQNENLTLPDAIRAFENALKLEPEAPSIHLMLGDCYARITEYEKAIRHTQKALALQGQGDFAVWMNLGQWSQFTGNQTLAQTCLQKAAAEADMRMDRHVANARQVIDWTANRAHISVLLGDKKEAHTLYNNMMKSYGARPLHYNPALLLPDTEQRLRRMRNIIRGRDTYIFCHGPSILALDRRWKEFAAHDSCKMGLNRFRVFETGFLSQTRSALDIAMLTHYRPFQQNIDGVIDFLSRDQQNQFITSKWAIDRLGSNCPTRQTLERRFDQKLLYFGNISPVTPATPLNPLGFLFGNTLSLLLTFAVIGGARRIFLFGVDGSVPANQDLLTHYGANDANFHFEITERYRPRVANALAADTMMFNSNVETGLIAAEHIFGIERPPIYNVSPDSAIDLFPRISYDEALEMLADNLAAGSAAAAG